MTMSNFPPHYAGGLLCGSLALSYTLCWRSPPRCTGTLPRAAPVLCSALLLIAGAHSRKSGRSGSEGDRIKENEVGRTKRNGRNSHRMMGFRWQEKPASALKRGEPDRGRMQRNEELIGFYVLSWICGCVGIGCRRQTAANRMWQRRVVTRRKTRAKTIDGKKREGKRESPEKCIFLYK